MVVTSVILSKLDKAWTQLDVCRDIFSHFYLLHIYKNPNYFFNRLTHGLSASKYCIYELHLLVNIKKEQLSNLFKHSLINKDLDPFV